MDPRQEYERRAAEGRARVVELQRSDARAAAVRGIAVALAVAFWFVAKPAIVGAALLFVLAAFWQQRARARRARRLRLVDWYDRALRRLDGEWDPQAPDGGEWLDPEHPYAGELDILGPHSLYAQMCHASTAGGRERLARWLCDPAPAQTVRERQDAVDELVGQLDVREAMLLAAPRRLGPPQLLGRWADLEGPSGLRLRASLALFFALATTLGALAWLSAGASAWPLLLAIVAAYLYARWLSPQLEATVQPLDHVRAELRAVEALLDLLDRAEFESEALRALVGRLHAEATTTRARLRALNRLAEWYDAARNAFFAPLAALWLWRAQFGILIESWRRRHRAELLAAIDALADYEALQSLARHAFENPGHLRPRIDPQLEAIHAQDLAHPLLPARSAVANDLDFEADCRLYVVSGSNMSGKSTWLRCIGVNVVLAMCGARVRAKSLVLPPLRVAASLRASDSLAAGESRFAAELHRLRIVVEEAERAPRLLFLLDEIFHGTHSQDRREGARALLARLLSGKHLGLVTTHDLALTDLDADLVTIARNVHFRDEVEGDRAVFDYRVHEGVVQHSNALRLMRARGLI